MEGVHGAGRLQPDRADRRGLPNWVAKAESSAHAAHERSRLPRQVSSESSARRPASNAGRRESRSRARAATRGPDERRARPCELVDCRGRSSCSALLGGRSTACGSAAGGATTARRRATFPFYIGLLICSRARWCSSRLRTALQALRDARRSSTRKQLRRSCRCWCRRSSTSVADRAARHLRRVGALHRVLHGAGSAATRSRRPSPVAVGVALSFS